MHVVFRADASLQIGTGHVMRCLTLADALAAKGANCQFICRRHDGNLIDFIQAKGYATHVLPMALDAGVDVAGGGVPQLANDLSHGAWLGTSQEQDAKACAAILAKQQPEWLIVDHYALDARWEKALKPYYRKLMAIDDLADREHICDLLLDQTFGRDAVDYRPLVPQHCNLLCGSQYALLRPEFAALRPYSLQRRANPQLRQLLITMGGVDKDNVTGKVLEALHTCPLPEDCRITVILGATAPWLEQVNSQAQAMPWPTQVLVGVNNMAQLMADSDLAIGAAGATSWERCCLGLPCIALLLAANQLLILSKLERLGAVVTVDLKGQMDELRRAIIDINSSYLLQQMSKKAASVVDGMGAPRIVSLFYE